MSERHVGDRPVDTEREIRTEPVGGYVPPEAPRDVTRPARRAPEAVVPQRRTARLRLGLATPSSLRAAVLAREILGPPKALQGR